MCQLGRDVSDDDDDDDDDAMHALELKNEKDEKKFCSSRNSAVDRFDVKKETMKDHAMW